CRQILAGGEDWRGLAGDVALAEGMLSAAEHRLIDAESQLKRALEIFTRHALAWQQAEALKKLGQGYLPRYESAPAAGAFDAAIAIYRRCDAGPAWFDRIEAARKASPPQSSNGNQMKQIENAQLTRQTPWVKPASPSLANEVSQQAVFKRKGDFWTLESRGRSFRLRDVKGLAYIAFLLAHPGERIHVHELIARVDGVADASSTAGAQISREVPARSGLGDAGIALDGQAQGEYRNRLRDLGEDLAEAERCNDSGRAESIRREQDFLRGELSAAVGLGGRGRKAAAHVERARWMV